MIQHPVTMVIFLICVNFPFLEANQCQSILTKVIHHWGQSLLSFYQCRCKSDSVPIQRKYEKPVLAMAVFWKCLLPIASLRAICLPPVCRPISRAALKRRHFTQQCSVSSNATTAIELNSAWIHPPYIYPCHYQVSWWWWCFLTASKGSFYFWIHWHIWGHGYAPSYDNCCIELLRELCELHELHWLCCNGFKQLLRCHCIGLGEYQKVAVQICSGTS